MTDFLLWYLGLQLMALPAVPVGLFLFRHLPDGGYGLSKALGLLLVAYPFWVLSLGGILPASRGGVILVLGLLLLGAGLVAVLRAEAMGLWWKRSRGAVLLSEALFALLLAFWSWTRAQDPAIDGTEKPMDFAFLNAAWRATAMPPEDPWLAGEGVSYYYLGYLVVALVARLTGVDPAAAFNLGVAAAAAVTATGLFSLAYSLCRLLAFPARRALLWALVCALLVTGAGNWEGGVEALRARGLLSDTALAWVGVKDVARVDPSGGWRPADSWWWWRATRVIDTVQDGRSLDYTITEFPFFSFLLGDLHPHLMSLPFTVLGLGLALSQAVRVEAPGRLLGGYGAELAFAALALGALGFLNSWDLPTYVALFVGAMLVQVRPEGAAASGRWRRSLLAGLAVAMGAVVLYLPFYLSFSTQAAGLALWTGPGTRPLHHVLVWGPVLAPLALFLWVALRRVAGWRAGAAGALALAPLLVWVGVEMARQWLAADVAAAVQGASSRVWPFLPLAGLTFVLVAGLRGRTPVEKEGFAQRGALAYLCLLSIGALLLIWGAETVMVRDVFGNRMNTVFKTYYQAWVLSGVAAWLGLALVWRWLGEESHIARWARPLRALGLGLAAVGAGMGLYYSVAALDAKRVVPPGGPTLDGLAFARAADPAEYEAVLWLRAQAGPGERILEAVGGEYSDYGRVSARTGVPALLGWPGHERQWRGSDRPFQGREQVVDRIYASSDWRETAQLLAEWQVGFVFVGRLERQRYGAALDKFEAFLEPAYRNGTVTVYRARGA